MSKALEDSEKRCTEMLNALENISSEVLSPKKVEEIKKRIEKIRDQLGKAKGKILMKTPSGERLASKAEVDVSELEITLKKLSKKTDPTLIKKLSEQLDGLEEDGNTIERYWKSYVSIVT
jgi:hypothetical protein